MNKWVISTLIFLIILTTIVLSIDTTQRKIINITNQTLKIVNSREFMNVGAKIENQTSKISNSENSLDNQITEIKQSELEVKQSTKLSNQDLLDLKFNELLNKKTEVVSIWDKNKKNSDVKISNHTTTSSIGDVKNKKINTTAKKVVSVDSKATNTVQNIENTTTKVGVKTPKIEPASTKIAITTQLNSKQTTIQNTEKIAKLTPQVVITQSTVKTKTLNFSSPDFQSELRTYITNNIKFPQGYVISFSFQYSKGGDIAEIHIISIPEKDYLDGDDTYISHIYGDVCKRDNLASNEMYYNNDSSISEVIAIPINSTQDGPAIKRFYDALKMIGKTHKIEQVSFEEQDNYTPIGGMYYLGNLYLYTN